MDTAQAIDTINNMIYLPGWKFTATDYTSRFEGTVRIRIDYPALNSNRDQAAEGYPDPIDTYAVFSMTVGDCDSAEDVYFKMIRHLTDIWVHETREFLRMPGSLEAPFHPHRLKGMQRWADKTGTPIAADLQFGIA